MADYGDNDMSLSGASEKYTVSLAEVLREQQPLTPLYMPRPAEQIMLTSTEVTRPGLPLAGYYGQFDAERVYVTGNTEHRYLEQLDTAERGERLKGFLSLRPATLIITNSLPMFDEGMDYAREYGVPVLQTSWNTSGYMAELIRYLNVALAPRITRHGVLVEVFGEGILILGDSGIGKSETAIELVKRGHRLIADDAVEIKRVSAKTLVGTAPEIIRHYVELRGIGIVDVRRIYGMGAVKLTEKVDLVVKLEPWRDGREYERIGMEDEHIEIMGIPIPCFTIPVRPGRNLAIIMEIAALNNRQKKMGYNTAEEFNKRLMGQMKDD